ncbi:unnamed protein product [Rotaria sp. Silwood2]|nr:unnamed protein product [Rotaria sp. Silwood2]CAF4343002.1 unnamed protein product [Rotaria sp. Silwood2]
MDRMLEEMASHTEQLLITSTNTSKQIKDNIAHDDSCHLSIKASISYQKPMLLIENTIEISRFSNEKTEDSEKGLDQVIRVIGQQNLSPDDQCNSAAEKLSKTALFWYRMNRLQLYDVQSLICQLLLTFNSLETTISAMKLSSKSLTHSVVLSEAVSRENFTYTRDNTWKPFTQQNGVRKPSYHVLRAAKKEKLKLIPDFPGSKNSVFWLKSLEERTNVFKLND